MEYDHENKGEQCSCWFNRIKKTFYHINHEIKNETGTRDFILLHWFCGHSSPKCHMSQPPTRWGRKGERLGDVTGRQYNARNSDVFLPRALHGLGGGDAFQTLVSASIRPFDWGERGRILRNLSHFVEPRVLNFNHWTIIYKDYLFAL